MPRIELASELENEGRLEKARGEYLERWTDLLIVIQTCAPLLLHDESREENHWLTLQCITHAHSVSAVSTQVSITAAGKAQVAEDRASGSYLSTNAPGVHFGVGKDLTVDAVEPRGKIV